MRAILLHSNQCSIVECARWDVVFGCIVAATHRWKSKPNAVSTWHISTKWHQKSDRPSIWAGRKRHPTGWSDRFAGRFIAAVGSLEPAKKKKRKRNGSLKRFWGGGGKWWQFHSLIYWKSRSERELSTKKSISYVDCVVAELMRACVCVCLCFDDETNLQLICMPGRPQFVRTLRAQKNRKKKNCFQLCAFFVVCAVVCCFHSFAVVVRVVPIGVLFRTFVQRPTEKRRWPRVESAAGDGNTYRPVFSNALCIFNADKRTSIPASAIVHTSVEPKSFKQGGGLSCLYLPGTVHLAIIEKCIADHDSKTRHLALFCSVTPLVSGADREYSQANDCHISNIPRHLEYFTKSRIKYTRWHIDNAYSAPLLVDDFHCGGAQRASATNSIGRPIDLKAKVKTVFRVQAFCESRIVSRSFRSTLSRCGRINPTRRHKQQLTLICII